MRMFRIIFAHLCIMFSGVFITLVILHLYNPSMGFLTSNVSLVYILCYCISVATLAVVTIAEQRRHMRIARKRAEDAAHKRHSAFAGHHLSEHNR